MMTDLSLGEWALIQRRRKRLTQEQLAQRAGVSVGAVSILENHPASSTLHNVASIFSGLGYEVRIRVKERKGVLKSTRSFRPRK